MNIQLYHHKTDGGAEYLTDQFVVCPNGDKEGVIENARFVVRIDGDIQHDAELAVNDCHEELVAACEKVTYIEEIDVLAECAYNMPTKKHINDRGHYADGYNNCLKKVKEIFQSALTNAKI